MPISNTQSQEMDGVHFVVAAWEGDGTAMQQPQTSHMYPLVQYGYGFKSTSPLRTSVHDKKHLGCFFRYKVRILKLPNCVLG